MNAKRKLTDAQREILRDLARAVKLRDVRAAENVCARWNSAHPRGTSVLALFPRDCQPRHCRTRSAAWVIESGEVVVLLEDVVGGVPISLLDDVPNEIEGEG
jgi:hypothetical protein